MLSILGITSNGFDTADSAGIGPVSVGVLSGVTATPTRGTGLSPPLIAAGVLLVAAGGFLARAHAKATASMRWVTFTESTHARERTGMLVDGRIHACDVRDDAAHPSW